MAPIDPSLRIAVVHLAVADLAASVDFYSRVMGLQLLESDGSRAVLGAGGEAALELTELEDPVAPPPGGTGLFHVAWLHPTRATLAETVRRIGDSRWPFTGASDHAVSEALYLDDPDGLGIEIYVDRPRDTWEPGPGGDRVRMVTLPLDVEDLLAQSEAAPPGEIDAATTIGHVHLKVSDVPAVDAFYRGLGFEQMASYPSASFVSAGGYHHHLGLNSWQSAGGSPAGADAPGLRRVTFELAGPAALQAVAGAAGAETDGGELSVRDPDGQLVIFRSA